MADISKEIQDFKDAEYGEEVRGSMISLAEKVNKDGEDALSNVAQQITRIDAAAESANHAVTIANAATGRADDTLDRADTVLAQAIQHAEDAAGSATKAESWAVGGTGSREGENGDNSMFYASKSKADADRSATEADRAAQYAQIVAPGFYIDTSTMELYIKAGIGVTFSVFDDNVLCWKVA